jgi:hypothetical protein
MEAVAPEMEAAAPEMEAAAPEMASFAPPIAVAGAASARPKMLPMMRPRMLMRPVPSSRYLRDQTTAPFPKQA